MSKEYVHSAWGYNRGCRCDICVAERKKLWEKNRKKRLSSEPPEHGTRSSYWNWGCRCELCKEGAFIFNREVMRRYKFGLEEEDFLSLLKNQDFKCRICGKDFDLDNTKAITIDHDHTCCPTKGKTCGNCIRSALCTTCNAALGFVYEDTSILRAMIDYIENPPSYNVS